MARPMQRQLLKTRHVDLSVGYEWRVFDFPWRNSTRFGYHAEAGYRCLILLGLTFRLQWNRPLILRTDRPLGGWLLRNWPTNCGFIEPLRVGRDTRTLVRFHLRRPDAPQRR